MTKLKDITDYLGMLFPSEIAEDFDNIGLLVGRADKDISKALICLDCDSAVVREAIEENAQLIITHHPVIFDPIKRICDDTPFGEMIISALENNISIYSAHTNLDSAPGGLTDEICKMLDLTPVSALDGNVGRICRAPKNDTAKLLSERIKCVLSVAHLYSTFTEDKKIKTVALVNGGGASCAESAVNLGVDVFISGDLKHHQFLHFKENKNTDFIEIRHFDCEFPVCRLLQEKLSDKFSSLNLKISEAQRNPLIDTDLIL